MKSKSSKVPQKEESNNTPMNDLSSEERRSVWVNKPSREMLKITCKWVKWMAQLLVFWILILLIVGVITIILSLKYNVFNGPLAGILYASSAFLLAGLTVVPTVLLFKMAQHWREGVESKESQTMEIGFRNQKKLWKFLGILFTILTLCVAILIGCEIYLLLSDTISGFSAI